MILILDPPVGPFSPAVEIRNWLQELAAKRTRYAGDADALAAIERAEAEARAWLAAANDASLTS